MNKVMLHDKLARAEQSRAVASPYYPASIHCNNLKVKDEPWSEDFYRRKTTATKWVSQQRWELCIMLLYA